MSKYKFGYKAYMQEVQKMNDKIPYISPLGRIDITQEEAETEILTCDKIYYFQEKYNEILEGQLKIQDTAIERLERQYIRATNMLFLSNICVVILLFALWGVM